MSSLDRIDDLLLDLRREGLRVGGEDFVRVHRVLRLLALERKSIDTPAELFRWLSPIVCRSRDEEDQLRTRLEKAALVNVNVNVNVNVDVDVEGETPAETGKGGNRPDVVRESESITRIEKERRYTGLGVLAAAAVVLVLLFVVVPLIPTGEREPRPEDLTPRETLDLSAWLNPPDRVAVIGLLWCTALIGVGFVAGRRRIRDERFETRDPETDLSAISMQSTPLFAERESRHSLQALRQHRRIPSRRIDVKRSVEATLRSADYPEFVFATRPETPRYLLISARRSPNSHYRDLAGQLVARLRDEGVFVEHFDFIGTPTRFSPAGDGVPTAYSIADLAAMHPDHRLLFVGEASALMDLRRGRPSDAAEELARMEMATLLTPTPSIEWGVSEDQLSRAGFTVLPLHSRGIEHLARVAARVSEGNESDRDDLAPHFGEQRSLPALLTQLEEKWLSEERPSPSDRMALVQALRLYLDEADFEWLCLLAVLPVIHPELTRHLGDQLGDHKGRPIAREDRLLRLARLPWLREAYMPRWLRSLLLDQLPRERLEEARDALQTVLLASRDSEEAEGKLPSMRGERARELLLGLARDAPEGSALRDPLFLDFLKDVGPERPEPVAPWRERVQRLSSGFRGVSGLLIIATLVVWNGYPPGGLLGSEIVRRIAFVAARALPLAVSLLVGLGLFGLAHWAVCVWRERPRVGMRWIDGALVGLVSLSIALGLLSFLYVPAGSTRLDVQQTSSLLNKLPVTASILAGPSTGGGESILLVYWACLLGGMVLVRRTGDLAPPGAPARRFEELLRPGVPRTRILLGVGVATVLAAYAAWVLELAFFWLFTGSPVPSTSDLGATGLGPMMASDFFAALGLAACAAAATLALRRRLRLGRGATWSFARAVAGSALLARAVAGLTALALSALAVDMSDAGLQAGFAVALLPGLAPLWLAPTFDAAGVLERRDMLRFAAWTIPLVPLLWGLVAVASEGEATAPLLGRVYTATSLAYVLVPLSIGMLRRLYGRPSWWSLVILAFVPSAMLGCEAAASLPSVVASGWMGIDPSEGLLVPSSVDLAAWGLGLAWVFSLLGARAYRIARSARGPGIWGVPAFSVDSSAPAAPWLWTPLLAFQGFFYLSDNITLVIGGLHLVFAAWLGSRYGRSALKVVALGGLPLLFDLSLTDRLTLGGVAAYDYLAGLLVCWAFADPASALERVRSLAGRWGSLTGWLLLTILSVNVDPTDQFHFGIYGYLAAVGLFFLLGVSERFETFRPWFVLLVVPFGVLPTFANPLLFGEAGSFMLYQVYTDQLQLGLDAGHLFVVTLFFAYLLGVPHRRAQQSAWMERLARAASSVPGFLLLAIFARVSLEWSLGDRGQVALLGSPELVVLLAFAAGFSGSLARIAIVLSVCVAVGVMEVFFGEVKLSSLSLSTQWSTDFLEPLRLGLLAYVGLRAHRWWILAAPSPYLVGRQAAGGRELRRRVRRAAQRSGYAAAATGDRSFDVLAYVRPSGERLVVLCEYRPDGPCPEAAVLKLLDAKQQYDEWVGGSAGAALVTNASGFTPDAEARALGEVTLIGAESLAPGELTAALDRVTPASSPVAP